MSGVPIYVVDNNNSNNNTEFLCDNIPEYKAEWRDKPKG